MAAVPINDAVLQATDAERSLLGAIMDAPHLWEQVETLRADDFAEPLHQRAWEAAQAIMRDGALVGLATMWAALAEDPALAALGGPAALADMVEEAPSHTAIPSLASVVSGNGRRRRLAAITRPGLTPQEMHAALAVELERPDPITDGKRLRATPFVLRPFSEIPPRQWLYGRHLIRKYVSCTVAPGGVGKSSLVLAEALAMCARRPLLGEAVHESLPLRVWYWNGEDDNEETERRIAALCIHHRLDANDLGDRLYIDSGRSTPLSLARETRDGFQIAAVAEKQLVEEIRARAIDVLVIDPFVAAHEISENDNAKVNAVVRLLARVADRTSCAVELVHHVRKPGGGDQGDTRVEDARGASSLIGAVRSARVLNVMSEEEAAKANVENRFGHVRVDNGKANMAPRGELATWRRLVSVDIGNGVGAYPGDLVGAVEAWAMPGPFAGISVAEAQQMQRYVHDGEWREDSQAKAWVGQPVALALGLDETDKDARTRIKSLVHGWVKAGALRVVEKRDAVRRPRAFVEVGEWISDGDL